MQMKNKYDVIIVGSGHAGSEAAIAAAYLGANVLIITSDITKIAQMSCNPAIGGIAKGQIVREIDALGGYTGIITDKSTIQFRMLNRSKGPAMWSPRAQCDRMIYSAQWRAIIETTKNLYIWQDSVKRLIINKDHVEGVITELGTTFFASSIILTTGTFLNGIIHIGKNSIQGGRLGDMAINGLSDQLKEYGIQVERMKTGTPPRIDIRSINIKNFDQQSGDENPERFSFLPILSVVQEKKKQRPCYIVYTSNKTHEILKKGFSDSPLFSGRIKGIGPRYCPSIEDKLRIFENKEKHQLFLEPEGWETNEYYLQGFSSSLPINIQIEALKTIEGFEDVHIFRPGYAIEYDFFPPTQLFHSLESKTISGLFFAGQVNGTTGYEEAAAQGIIAGVNAYLKLKNKPCFVLKRDQAYIGVLVDDLVTKGVDEPYRMFTSRAENRILLRQDNADVRLTEISYKLGLASEERMKIISQKSSTILELTNFLENESAKPENVNNYLTNIGSSIIFQKRKWSELLTRPFVELDKLLLIVPRETNNKIIQIINKLNEIDENSAKEIIKSVEIAIKYKGYIFREKTLAEKLMRLDYVQIPKNFSFKEIESLSIEARQKLMKIKPSSIGQASRIPGVSPSDISVLLMYFGR